MIKEIENGYNVCLKKTKEKSITEELKEMEKGEKSTEDRFYKDLAFGTDGQFNNYDIIVLAGQSNADGFGISKKCQEYDDDIQLLVDRNLLAIYGNLNINYDTFHNDLYPANIKQVKVYDRPEKDFYRGCFAYSFAKEYVKKGLLEQGRKLLIVKTAVGGTCFLKNQWGVGNVLHKRLIQMVDYALNLGADSRIVAFLWHQGETDTDYRLEIKPQERREFYHDKLLSMIKDFRNKYGLYDLPFISGEMSYSFIEKNQENSKAITEATRDVCKELKNASFVRSNGLFTNENDVCHFSYDSLEELGKRYFREFIKIKQNS